MQAVIFAEWLRSPLPKTVAGLDDSADRTQSSSSHPQLPDVREAVIMNGENSQGENSKGAESHCTLPTNGVSPDPKPQDKDLEASGKFSSTEPATKTASSRNGAGSSSLQHLDIEERNPIELEDGKSMREAHDSAPSTSQPNQRPSATEQRSKISDQQTPADEQPVITDDSSSLRGNLKSPMSKEALGVPSLADSDIELLKSVGIDSSAWQPKNAATGPRKDASAAVSNAKAISKPQQLPPKTGTYNFPLSLGLSLVNLIICSRGLFSQFDFGNKNSSLTLTE